MERPRRAGTVAASAAAEACEWTWLAVGTHLAAAAAATPRPVVVIVTEARTPIRLWLLTLLKLRTPCGLGRAARAPATRASERRASILLR